MSAKPERTWHEIAQELLAAHDPQKMIELAVDLETAFDRDEANRNSRSGESVRRERMIGQRKEEWMKLCEQAAAEQDPAKLMKLIAEIDRMLAEKEQRLKAARPGGQADKAEPTTKFTA